MKYLGTDGIRGKTEMFNDGLLRKVARALRTLSKDFSVTIGRDTRTSGKDMEMRLTRALTEEGARVTLLGILTTPACAFLTKSLGCEWGIMISASHNPPEYNGLKFFNGRGEKLCGEIEERLDFLIEGNPRGKSEGANRVGCFSHLHNPQKKYLQMICKEFGGSLSGMKILLDVAHGGGAHIAPNAFKIAGADVTVMNGESDGERINVDCGATCEETLLAGMCGEDYDLGFAFDGDGDRVIGALNGITYNGDHLMYVLAKDYKAKNKLRGGGVAMTISGNFGIEESLGRLGIQVYRADVGDKNLFKLMEERGLNLGSEASGHVINTDYLPTGDGVLTALQIAKIAREEDIAIIDDAVEYPQFSTDVVTDGKSGKRVLEALEESRFTERLAECGVRAVVRMSGTENKLRILTESPSSDSEKTALFALEQLAKSFLVNEN